MHTFSKIRNPVQLCDFDLHSIWTHQHSIWTIYLNLFSKQIVSSIWTNFPLNMDNLPILSPLKLPGLSPWNFTGHQVIQKVENAEIPPNNDWRMILLKKLLTTRRQMSAALEDTGNISLMIDSLCNTWSSLLSLTSGCLRASTSSRTINMRDSILVFKIELFIN